MKKYISIIISILFVLLACGCSLFSTKLTGSNINDYLNIKVFTESRPDGKHTYFSEKVNGEDTFLYTYIILNGRVKGASKNFNYNDVKIKMKVTMECQGFELESRDPSSRTFEEEIEFDTNIAGNAENFRKVFELDDFGTNPDLVNLKVEITDIQGNVSKAK